MKQTAVIIITHVIDTKCHIFADSEVTQVPKHTLIW